jgi:hypothetical protein
MIKETGKFRDDSLSTLIYSIFVPGLGVFILGKKLRGMIFFVVFIYTLYNNFYYLFPKLSALVVGNHVSIGSLLKLKNIEVFYFLIVIWIFSLIDNYVVAKKTTSEASSEVVIE